MVRRRGLTLIEVVIVVVIAGVAVGVILPFLAAARERARRTRCYSNLVIGHMCRHYARDFGGDFPPTMGHLYPDFISDGKVFLCPSAGRTTPVEDDPRYSRGNYTPAMFGDTHTDYVYVSGLKLDDPETYILIFDDEWNHDGEGINVCTIGLGGGWMSDIKAVHEQLARQEEELAAKGREMKVLHPAWSRFPELPPRPPWYSSPGGRAVAIGAFAAVAVALALVVRTVNRGRERRSRED